MNHRSSLDQLDGTPLEGDGGGIAVYIMFLWKWAEKMSETKKKSFSFCKILQDSICFTGRFY